MKLEFQEITNLTMRTICILILFMFTTLVSAQQVDSTHVDSRSINWVNSIQAGFLLVGNNEEETLVRPTTRYSFGISFQKISALIGIGISDYYNYLIVPLTLEMKYKILKSGNTPFIYSNIGKGMNLLENKDTQGGLNAAIGVGFQWKLGDVNLFMSSGYQIQKVKTTYENYHYYDRWILDTRFTTPSSYPTFETVRSMRRATFSVGLIF